MANPLPQQRLLLEMLVMAGDIAVTTAPDDSVLWRTLRECQKAGWITLNRFAHTHAASITTAGRRIVKEP